jgi:hypothetical protein
MTIDVLTIAVRGKSFEANGVPEFAKRNQLVNSPGS